MAARASAAGKDPGANSGDLISRDIYRGADIRDSGLMNTIQSIGVLSRIMSTGQVTQNSPALQEPISFKELLADSMSQVDSVRHSEGREVNHLAMSQNRDSTEFLESLHKSEITFHLMVQAQEKIVQAYNEIHNMRI